MCERPNFLFFFSDSTGLLIIAEMNLVKVTHFVDTTALFSLATNWRACDAALGNGLAF